MLPSCWRPFQGCTPKRTYALEGKSCILRNLVPGTDTTIISHIIARAIITSGYFERISNPVHVRIAGRFRGTSRDYWPLGSLIGRPHLAQPDMTMCDHRLGTSYLDFNSL